MLPLRSTDLGTQDRARLPPYEAALLRQDPTRWPGDDTVSSAVLPHTRDPRTLPITRALSRCLTPEGQLTCAETFVPSLPLLLNCNGPKHFHVGGSGGMLSVGHAACTEYAELSHRSRRQSVGSRRLDKPSRGPSGEGVPGWDSAPLFPARGSSLLCRGPVPPSPPPLVPEPYLCGL